MEDDAPPAKVRQPLEVANRALALFAVVGTAFGAPREDVIPWLRENSLWSELSHREAKFLSDPSESPKMRADFGWHSERLLMLLWALGKIPQLPPNDEQCNTKIFQSLLPPFSDDTVDDFLRSAALLSDETLFAKADDLLNAHWKARNADRLGLPAPEGIEIEIVQERHHAINWITGYEELPWDDVTTDT